MRLLLDNNPINHNRFTLNYDDNSYTNSIIYRFLIHKRTQVGGRADSRGPLARGG